MRNINLIIVHCSDSDIPGHDNIETIRKWHIEENGWSDVGYHYFITKDGEVHSGRSLERAGAHCKGFNKSSIGICLSGRNEFTEEQFQSLRDIIKDELIPNLGLSIIDILGHRDLNKGKSCPNFDVQEILRGDRNAE